MTYLSTSRGERESFMLAKLSQGSRPGGVARGGESRCSREFTRGWGGAAQVDLADLIALGK